LLFIAAMITSTTHPMPRARKAGRVRMRPSPKVTNENTNRATA